MIAVHNFSPDGRTARLDLDEDLEVIGDLLADQVYDVKNLSELALGGYGYRWIRFHRR